MDEHGFSESTASKDEPSGPDDRRKAAVVRTGVIVCAAGLVITLFGAWRISHTRGYTSPLSATIHTLGMVTMLLGFAVILLGYRTSWLTAASQIVAEVFQPQRAARRETGRSHAHSRRSRQASPLLLAALSLLVLISVSVIYYLPQLLAGIYIVAFTTFLGLALLVTVVYGTSRQRTFCIGAALPLGLAAWQRLPCDAAFIFQWILTRRFPVDDEWETLATLLEFCGASTKIVMSAVWVGAILSGLGAVILRVVLDHLNEREQVG